MRITAIPVQLRLPLYQL